MRRMATIPTMSMPAPTPPTRSDDEKLALALRLAERIEASAGLGMHTNVAIHAGGGGVKVAVTEGTRAEVRDLLADLRQFNSPSEDVYIPKIHAILLKRQLQKGWSAGFTEARRDWFRAQEPGMYQVQDPDVPVAPDGTVTYIKPPDAWRMWVYVEHLHSDYALDLRYKRLNEGAQGFVQAMARDYNATLLEQVSFILRVLRHGLERPLP